VWENAPVNEPDPGSVFLVNYTADSIIARYLDASEEQFDTTISKVDESLSSKLVNSATGEDLDEIGKLFGPIIGSRDGRNDAEYRAYLKSVAQSFISRGTIGGIRGAIATAVSVDIDDVSIEEFFDTNEYNVIIVPNNPIIGSIIEQVAELADPSGVKLRQTRFRPPADKTGIQDAALPREIAAASPEDAVNVFDGADIDPNKAFDDTDTVDIDDVITLTTDDILVWAQTNWGNVWGGSVVIPGAFDVSSTDVVVIDDSVTTSESLVAKWDDNTWGVSEWE